MAGPQCTDPMNSLRQETVRHASGSLWLRPCNRTPCPFNAVPVYSSCQLQMLALSAQRTK